MAQARKYLIVIGGPTASGKTSLAIHLAKKYTCSIISADSRQIYQEMNIGTAKPSPEELSAVPHYLINHIDIKTPFSVGQYESDALKVLTQQFEHQDITVAAGGTGLYLKALVEGIDEFPRVPQHIFDTFKTLLEKDGIEQLQQELLLKDPNYYKMVDLDNPHRLIRALSVISISGSPFSSFLNKRKTTRSFTPILIALDLPRELLYQRINQRVDQMITEGLVEEVQKLLPYSELNSLNTVGYKEIFKYLRGEWTLEEAIEKIKQHTRNYAKRQVTWFKNQQDYCHFSPNDIQQIEEFIAEKQSPFS